LCEQNPQNMLHHIIEKSGNIYREQNTQNKLHHVVDESGTIVYVLLQPIILLQTILEHCFVCFLLNSNLFIYWKLIYPEMEQRINNFELDSRHFLAIKTHIRLGV
jgi:hypothetical protein